MDLLLMLVIPFLLGICAGYLVKRILKRDKFQKECDDIFRRY